MTDYPVTRAITGIDRAGIVRDTNVHARGGNNFALTLSRPFLEFVSELHPFLSDTFGAAMNQNIGFSGNPTIIHAGVNSGAALTGTTTGTTSDHLIDTSETFANISVGFSVKNTTSGNEYALVTAVATNDLTLDNDIFVSGETYEINPIWVGTAVQGTWNFADSGKITITAADNNDEASFDNDVGQVWNMANHTTFTGTVDLDIYNPVNNAILIKFDLDGVLVGNEINLNDFIDTGDFAEQSFVIPKAAFGLATQNINGMSVCITRMGGTKPTIKFDDLKWEETGDVEIFRATTRLGTIFKISELHLTIIDALAGTLADGTMTALSHDKILNVAELGNGILFSNVQDGATIFAVPLRNIGDILATGAFISNAISDGTNTFVTLTITFPEPVILDGGQESFLAFSIRDDLSGLIRLSAVARGALEVEARP